MKLNKLLCGVAVTAVVVIASVAAPAYADTIDYTLTDGSSDVITFALPATPTTLAATSTVYFAVATTVDVDGTEEAEDVTFYDTSFSGGLSIATTPYTDQVLDQEGPQLYSGTTSDPTLLPESDALLSGVSLGGTNEFGGPFTLNAVDVPTSTPEPASLSLTLAGIGMLGLMMVMRKRSARGLTQPS